MSYNYTLEEKDYHTHLLYTISRSSSAMKTRARIRLLMTLSLLLFSLMAYGNGSKGQMVYFLILAVAAFFFMPNYTRWSYSRSYLKHVRNYYKDRMTEPTAIKINSNSIDVSDSQGESKIEITEIDAVNRLKDYYFLKLKSGQSIIIPITKIESAESLTNDLKQLTEKHNISWNDETNWEWR